MEEQMSAHAMPALRWGYMVLSCADLDRQVEWYGRVLGMACVQRGGLRKLGVEFAVLEGHGIQLELAQRDGIVPEARVPADPPDHQDMTGWTVLTLHCDDLGALSRHLAAQGVGPVWDARSLAPGICSTLLRDAEGNLINVFGPAQFDQG